MGACCCVQPQSETEHIIVPVHNMKIPAEMGGASPLYMVDVPPQTREESPRLSREKHDAAMSDTSSRTNSTSTRASSSPSRSRPSQKQGSPTRRAVSVTFPNGPPPTEFRLTLTKAFAEPLGIELEF